MSTYIIMRDFKLKKDGSSPLYLRTFILKKKVEIPLNLHIPEDYWDQKSQLIKPDYPDAEDLNLVIGQALARANKIFINYRLWEKDLTPDLFRHEFKNPAERIDFYSFMDEEIKAKKGILAASTLIHHKAVLSKLKRFKKTLCFAEIDVSLIEKFEKYLKVTCHNGINTRWTNQKTFKEYINIALKKGFIERNPYINFKIKSEKTLPPHLTEDELKILVKLYKKEELPAKHQRVLRHFLFTCFTSLRVSDLKSLSQKQIISGIIVKNPLKTRNVNNQMVTIPIPKSAHILIKDEKSDGVFVFDTISDQKMNSYLKEIAAVAELHKRLSMHVGRHTFATTFLHRTKDLATLQQLMGHSKIEETMKYVHISEQQKKEGMAKMDDLMD